MPCFVTQNLRSELRFRRKPTHIINIIVVLRRSSGDINTLTSNPILIKFQRYSLGQLLFLNICRQNKNNVLCMPLRMKDGVFQFFCSFRETQTNYFNPYDRCNFIIFFIILSDVFLPHASEDERTSAAALHNDLRFFMYEM